MKIFSKALIVVAVITLCAGCTHSEQLAPVNHSAAHEKNLQVALDNAEHNQACYDCLEGTTDVKSCVQVCLDRNNPYTK